MAMTASSTIPELTLGTRLYMARKKAGLSQQDLADACDVSRALVSMWERDIDPGPRHAHVETWAETTGINARWLHGGYAALVQDSGYKPDLAVVTDPSPRLPFDLPPAVDRPPLALV